MKISVLTLFRQMESFREAISNPMRKTQSPFLYSGIAPAQAAASIIANSAAMGFSSLALSVTGTASLQKNYIQIRKTNPFSYLSAIRIQVT